MSQFTDNTEDTMVVVLLTQSPSHTKTAQAYAFVKNLCDLNEAGKSDKKIKIFLYSDAVMLANRLIWLPADIENMAKNWQQLAVTLKSSIQVCVSAALARGVTDQENAARHGLNGNNLAEGFELVGLGELAMHLHSSKTVYQF